MPTTDNAHPVTGTFDGIAEWSDETGPVAVGVTAGTACYFAIRAAMTPDAYGSAVFDTSTPGGARCILTVNGGVTEW